VRQLAYAFMALVAFPVIGAEVYRSVDANGNVVYSDRPEGDETQLVHIATPGAAARPAARATVGASDVASSAASTAPAPEVSGGEIREEPTAEELAAERERNCALSKERAERYRISHRLYRNLPNGEREYLSDDEIDDARAKAEADVANWCR
jgi:hypothetical protein